MRHMRRRVGFLVALLAVLALAMLMWPYARGLSLLVRAADLQGTPRRAADLLAREVAEREMTIETAGRALRARAYEPAGRFERTAIVVPGLHAAGIDEPRLMALSRALAASGIAVVTPEIPEIAAFEISPAITDAIEQTALSLAADARLAPDGRVGIMGISFSGGLAVVAAGRPALRGRVAYVFSFGGHADLRRVLRYMCTGVAPAPRVDVDLGAASARLQTVPPPHDYGVAVILLRVADKVVPPAQVRPLREAVRRFLTASHLDRLDKPAAEREFEALRARARQLPEPSATLLKYVNERDVVHLGARLLPFTSEFDDAESLSPVNAPAPSGPVFLLHGLDDDVIPTAESVFLADHLRGKAPVRLLLTGLVSHAEAQLPARPGDALELAGFLGDVLAR
jgi:dienelactone hydrolase